MNKKLLKHYTALLLIAAIFFSLFTAPALAATAIDIGVDGLAADYEGGTWSASNGTVTGSVKTTSSTGCGGTTYNQQSGTLTLKNTSGSEATLKLRVKSADTNGGTATITINGEAVAAKGGSSHTVVLYQNASISIDIESSNTATNTTTIELENIELVPPTPVSITFVPTQNGSYTVDGASITTETIINKMSTDEFALSATAASGYKFAGWVDADDAGAVISSNNPDSLIFTKDRRVTARFVEASTPVFDICGSSFYDLNSAVSHARSEGHDKITLISNGILPAGDYTIPSGITLLIPFDDAHTLYTTTPEVVYGTNNNPSYFTPTAFRTLEMASGANITVQTGGALALGGKLSSQGQLGGWNGTPTGPDGRIKMNTGSSISLKNGANLYCWGYIHGSGEVTAESGAAVYEAFQIKDWRGGTATSNVYGYAFIFNQYYIQNIEVPLKVYAGASVKLYSSVNASSRAYPMAATLIGSGGLFNLTSGYIVKDYIESTDRLDIKVCGNVSIAPMTMTGLPIIGSINTSSYVLPITSNLSIDIQSGTTSVTQDIELLPGVEIKIRSDAELRIDSGKRAYVYDNDDWGRFLGNVRLRVIGYSVANGTTTKRTDASLADAKIDVNGVLSVNGSLYTSAGGANITSSNGTSGENENGKIVFNNAPTANSTVYEANGTTGNVVTVDFTAPKLHNGDEYSETVDTGISTWYYDKNGKDSKGGEHWYRYTVDFVYNGETLARDYYCENNDTITYDASLLSLSNIGASVTSGSAAVAAYETAVNVTNVTSDTVVTLTGEAKTYTVTWKNWNGDVLETDGNVQCDTPPSYDGEEPEREATAQYTYTFDGWTIDGGSGTVYAVDELPAVTEDAVFIAHFAETVNKYTVTWKNWDDAVLETDYDVPYGTTPSYDGALPEKLGDAEHSYVFAGWEPSVADVTGNADYTATFTEVTNTYTVTWQNWNGDVLETDDVPYGTVPTYDSAAPTREDGGIWDYIFAGWSPEIESVTGPAAYTAVFEKQLNTRELTIEVHNEVAVGIEHMFIFDIVRVRDNMTVVTVPVLVKAGQSASIKVVGLPAGEYRVICVSDWSTELTVASNSTAIVDMSVNSSVVFENSPGTINWLKVEACFIVTVIVKKED